MTSDSTPETGIRAPADLNPRADPCLDFPDADYGTLTPGDYDVLGFMSGLEVHQQLLTRSKLFCRCPAGRYTTRNDAVVLRHMRPTLSELGEYDGTALMEFKTKKEIVYLLERDSVCTYEIDDTPPFGIDDAAVHIAIEVAQLLNLNLVSELHVMRKQYLDGSIPTGFQRTVMIGLDGAVPFAVPELGVKRELRIRQLSLEEDSCREVSDIGHRISFTTARLGMPLTEIVTQPELLTPLEVQAAGRLLADVARATGKVRRGSGAARQDVNVSVAGGRRVEIKGVDNHRKLPRLVHIEAFRQLNLLRIRAELERRGVTHTMLAITDTGVPWEVSPLVIDAGGILRRTADTAVARALAQGEMVCAVRLPGFGGLLAHRTQPGIRFAQEFSERIRVIACPVHPGFMTHSDAHENGIGAAEWRELRAQLGAGAETGDAVVLIWASPEDVATAAREVLIRARDALAGVPAETRQVHRDGTTGFERILPGSDRMYPDTDTPPLPVADALVQRIRAGLPETPWARERRYHRLGLASITARRLARSPWAAAFDAAIPESGAAAPRLAASLLKRMPYHERCAGARPVLDGGRLATVVRAIPEGEVRAEALDRMLDALVTEPDVPAADIVQRYRRGQADEVELERALTRLSEPAVAFAGRDHDTILRWALGQIMPSLLGKVDPAHVRNRIAGVLLAAVPEAAS